MLVFLLFGLANKLAIIEMTDWKLRLYHRMPPLVRGLFATLRGYELRSWRYSSETERLVEEALERDHWSSERWKTHQEDRLAYVLHRAATRVPFYREEWTERRRRGDKSSWDYLENWALLDKEPLRQQSRAFIADDCDIKKLFHEHTSGTTGKPLDLWWSRETVKSWYALCEARWRKWYGVSRHQRWAILGGQLVTPFSQEKPPFWVWNYSMHQLYLSSYHLSASFLPYYLDALINYRIRYIVGYTSALYVLAQHVLSSGRNDLHFDTVISNAEPVYPYQRKAIEEAFQCTLMETYGMAEIVTAAGECGSGCMHLWPEVGWVEILEQDRPVSLGETGDIVATGLLNTDMPLIRYRIGDRAAMSPVTSCECGRNLPQFHSIEGRIDEVLFTRDGRRIGRLDPIFKTQLPVLEAQIIQERLDLVRVRYVPTAEYTEEAGKDVIQRIRARLGEVDVILEAVTAVPRTSNGKFRAVICQIPRDERVQLEGKL